VAHLAAQGLTNRQVATRLYVSPHTVGARLRQIYRRLDIASRVDLTRIVTELATKGRGVGRGWAHDNADVVGANLTVRDTTRVLRHP
jgi:hypothetical protein